VIQYKKGTCTCHGYKDVYIVKKNAKGKYCQEGNKARLEEKRGVKKPKPIRKKRKPTGEKIVFEVVWNTRPHKCGGCGTKLYEPRAAYFSHIIKKGRRPDLRLVYENVLLDCIDCHRIWDFGTLEQKRKLKNFEDRLAYISKVDIALYVKLTQD